MSFEGDWSGAGPHPTSLREASFSHFVGEGARLNFSRMPKFSTAIPGRLSLSLSLSLSLFWPPGVTRSILRACPHSRSSA